MITWDRVNRDLQRLKDLSVEFDQLVRGFGEVEALRREGLREEARRKSAYLEARLRKCHVDLDKSLTALLRSVGLGNIRAPNRRLH
jgi:hypothetical protein